MFPQAGLSHNQCGIGTLASAKLCAQDRRTKVHVPNIGWKHEGHAALAAIQAISMADASHWPDLAGAACCLALQRRVLKYVHTHLAGTI